MHGTDDCKVSYIVQFCVRRMKWHLIEVATAGCIVNSLYGSSFGNSVLSCMSLLPQHDKPVGVITLVNQSVCLCVSMCRLQLFG